MNPSLLRDQPTLLSRTCWAAPLGGCSKKISREHVVSEAVTRAFPVGLGFDIHERTRRIPASAAKVKILCQTHNTALSSLDAEAGRLIRAITNYFKTPLTTQLLSKGALEETRMSIDGKKFERWLLKTFFNHVVLRTAFRPQDKIRHSQGTSILEHVFLATPLPRDCGLYLFPVNKKHALSDFLPAGRSFNGAPQFINSRVHRKESGGWGPLHMIPMWYYFAIFDHEFALRANLSTLGGYWHQVIEDNSLDPKMHCDFRPANLGFWKTPTHRLYRSEVCSKLWVDFDWKLKATPVSARPKQSKSS